MIDLHQKISYLPEVHRLLPQSSDAEQGILSSIMLSPQWAMGVCQEKGARPESFHIPAHRAIYEALASMSEANHPIDAITLTQRLRDLGQLDSCGGPAFISLLGNHPTAANVGHYAGIVADKFILREIIRVCTELAARGYDEQDQVSALLDEAEKLIFAIRASDDGELIECDPKQAAMQAIAEIERLYENKGAITGLATGFAELDRMTDGLHGGEMFVIAARPSMGKTALGMCIAEHVALHEKKPVAVFSAEMSAKQLHLRLLCSVARTNIRRVSDGYMAERDFPALTSAATKIAQSKLLIVDAVGASINAVRAKARRMHRKHGLGLMLVDFLQCLRSTSRQALNSREREISEISSGLKTLAKELDIPVIVLAQLNRDVEKRNSHRPRLSDLRESGSTEQDADIAGLLVREEYYAETEEEKRECQGEATLIIAKSRNGPVGDVPLTFLKELMRFEDRAREAEPEFRNYHPDI